MEGRVKHSILAVGVVIACLVGGNSYAETYSFEGKTVQMVIPFSAGGPTDLFARLIGNQLQDRLPGRPVIKPVNMPGGGGVLGSNYVYGSGNVDGTMILIGTVVPWYQIIGDPLAQYDVAKTPMIASLGEPEVIYTSKASDIFKDGELNSEGHPIRGAALSPNNTKSVLYAVLSNLLGYETKIINGYPGAAEMRLAVQRNEADLSMETLAGFFGGVANKEAFKPVMQTGASAPDGTYVRDARLTGFDLPTAYELVEKKRGTDVWNTAEGKALKLVTDIYDVLRTISLPPSTDPAAVDAIREAFSAMFQDEQFLAEAQRINGYQLTFRDGEATQKVVQDMIAELQSDPELGNYIRQLTAPE